MSPTITFQTRKNINTIQYNTKPKSNEKNKLLLLLGRLLPGWKHNLSFEHRNLHKLIKSTILLTEFLNLVSINHKTGPTAQVKGVITRPDIDHVLLLGTTSSHDQLTIAVDLGVFVEFRVYVLLPAGTLERFVARQFLHL